jgi:hypothetical protein
MCQADAARWFQSSVGSPYRRGDGWKALRLETSKAAGRCPTFDDGPGRLAFVAVAHGDWHEQVQERLRLEPAVGVVSRLPGGSPNVKWKRPSVFEETPPVGSYSAYSSTTRNESGEVPGAATARGEPARLSFGGQSGISASTSHAAWGGARVSRRQSPL